MPIFVQPALRARQRQLELAGDIQTRNGVLFTIFQTLESLNVQIKVVPKFTINADGTIYTPTATS